MKGIVGLGNPGIKYKNNRHNTGFMVLDALAEKLKLTFKRNRRFKAFIANGKLEERKFILVKPYTFMNNSGVSVKKIFENFHFTYEDLLVIYDDVDLPLGVIRYRKKGSSGGHLGMESIIKELNTTQIPRLRIGIGRPNERNLVDYVLSDFTEDERGILEEVISRAVSICLKWIINDRDFVIQNYNQ